jgi:hypothetical protein
VLSRPTFALTPGEQTPHSPGVTYLSPANACCIRWEYFPPNGYCVALEARSTPNPNPHSTPYVAPAPPLALARLRPRRPPSARLAPPPVLPQHSTTPPWRPTAPSPVPCLAAAGLRRSTRDPTRIVAIIVWTQRRCPSDILVDLSPATRSMCP